MFVAVVTVIAAALVIATLYFFLKPSDPLPAKISNEVTFITYIPSGDWSIKKGTEAFSDTLLAFTAQQKSGSATTVAITQQSSPEIFNDVPQYYPTLLDRLKQYASFGSVHGTVYLTRPAELKGKQQAIMNSKGTLMFVHSTDEMSEAEWRKFFNTLQLRTP